jgi:HEAT repeat protein
MNKFLVIASVGLVLFLSGCSNKDSETIRKSDTLVEVREYGKAFDLLNNALRDRKDSKKLHRARIRLLLRMERPDAAFAAYKELTEKISKNDAVLIDSLEDKDAVIRANAARALGFIGDPQAISALTKALKDPERNVRRAAVYGLGEIQEAKGSGAVPALVMALKDEYWFVRSEAAQALGKIRDPRGTAPLFGLLDDSDNSVKNAAKNALITLVQADTSEYLKQLQNTEQPNSAWVAALALTTVENKAAVPVLIANLQAKDAPRRYTAAQALAQQRDISAAPALRPLLKDSEKMVRGQAVLALASIKDRDSLPDLKSIAASSSEDPNVKNAAVQAVKYLETAQP